MPNTLPIGRNDGLDSFDEGSSSASATPRRTMPPHPVLKTEHSEMQRQFESDDTSRSPAVERDTSQTPGKPPAKRARKAINCEPCRASKLKCDRGKPCSSCVLRGTALHCYQGAAVEQNDDPRGSKIDPHQEIAHIRQSLATLEAFVIRSGVAPPTSSSPTVSFKKPPTPLYAPPDSDGSSSKSVPGMLAQEGQGGFYAGPTSMVTHLLNFKSADQREGRDDGSGDEVVRSNDDPPISGEQSCAYDDDLLALLPQLEIIDGLLDFYFESCNWIYRHVCPEAFRSAWAKFKTGRSSDRLTLSTLCVIMAIAVRYLPEGHALSASVPREHEELSDRYYGIARDALSRNRSESRALSLELVELLLIRTHYLTLSKTDAEEIWAIRGELVSIGTAMGLHRDPDKWKMPRDLAERRRWAWWHVILLERWQCFLFGRPLSIASHHFDTRPPSYVDPSIDPSGRLFLPNVHFFRLAYILGNIVDDAVSIRPQTYESVQERDRELLNWMEELPKELDLDEYRLARYLASPLPSSVRLAAQSIVYRTSYYHIRFSLHRPYAAAAHDAQRQNGTSKKRSASGSEASERMGQSLDIAVGAADKLIQLVGHGRTNQSGNSSHSVPFHLHWGPFHCFSAAMFFSFQLIANPDQPGASLFRTNIQRVLDILNTSRGVAIADKAVAMLTALGPLYEAHPPGETTEDREKKKKQVLSVVKGLAFPYHDSPAYPRSHIESPGRNGSPVYSNSASPPGASQGIPPIVSSNAPSPSTDMQFNPAPTDSLGGPLLSHVPAPTYAQAAPHVQSAIRGVDPFAASQSSVQHQGPRGAPLGGPGGVHSYTPQLQTMRAPNYPLQQPEYGDVAFSQGANESMWGASVGFGQGEWARFLDVMQRPDAARM